MAEGKTKPNITRLAFALGVALFPAMGCGSSGSRTISLSNADSGRTVVAAVGDKIDVTLQPIGPGQYGPPSTSVSVTFLGESSPPGQPNPGGVRQLYRFEVVASGRADITIPHSGSAPQSARPAFGFTVEVP
jgi:hypothetical protein